MLNLKNIAQCLQRNTPAVKKGVMLFAVFFSFAFHSSRHPYYIGVTELTYDEKQQNLHVSVKLFTNDLENALRKTSGKAVDLLNPKNKAQTDSILSDYINKRLHINLNSKVGQLTFLGYEKEEEAIWSFFEIEKVKVPGRIDVETTLLYETLPQQIHIIHANVNGIKKSSKVTNPDPKISFLF